MLENSSIVGRYAPSPTGDLHMGNLRTAVLAWLHARLQGGRFLLRMEDIDLARVLPGSADQILRDLEWLGLDWDGEVVFQSERLDLYKSALNDLHRQGLIYPCFCSRKDIREAASAPQFSAGEKRSELIYPGTCRLLDTVKIEKQDKQPALRLRVNDELENQCGDFVVKRADDLYAYQLVVVVDDLCQGITQVVRGVDLADSTKRQQYIASLLAKHDKDISYFHAPLMMDESGQRMAKRDGSLSISAWRDRENSKPEHLLAMLLQSLGVTEEKQISSVEALEMFSLQEIEGCLL